MPGFKDQAELSRYVGGVFERALADPELGPKLAETGLVLRMRCTEPDSALTIDFPNHKVHEGDEGPAADATMTMSTATANAYWQGKVNLPFAMARGRVKVEGAMTKLLNLAPLSRSLYPGYLQALREDRRDDLIEK